MSRMGEAEDDTALSGWIRRAHKMPVGFRRFLPLIFWQQWRGGRELIQGVIQGPVFGKRLLVAAGLNQEYAAAVEPRQSSLQ